MQRRLFAALILALVAFEGCGSSLPPVDMNAPAPSGPPPDAAPAVIAKKKTRFGAETPKATPSGANAN